MKLLKENDGKLVTTNQIDKDGKTRRGVACPNMAGDIVPVIAQLLNMDDKVAYAYLCNPAVKHVSKLMKEGMFPSPSLNEGLYSFRVDLMADCCRWLLWV